MVISPAVIESEEVIRQAVPAKMGFAGIAARNRIGTVPYFTLFNLGLIAVLIPAAAPPTVRTLDRPVLVGVSLLVAILVRPRAAHPRSRAAPAGHRGRLCDAHVRAG